MRRAFDPSAVERVADAIRRDRYLSHAVSDVALVEKVLSTYDEEKPRRARSSMAKTREARR